MGLFNIRSHLTVSIKWLTWQLLIPGSLARRTSQHNCSCCTCQLIPDNNLRRQFVVLNGKKNWQQSPLPCYCVLTGRPPPPPEQTGQRLQPLAARADQMPVGSLFSSIEARQAAMHTCQIVSATGFCWTGRYLPKLSLCVPAFTENNILPMYLIS